MRTRSKNSRSTSSSLYAFGRLKTSTRNSSNEEEDVSNSGQGNTQLNQRQKGPSSTTACKASSDKPSALTTPGAVSVHPNLENLILTLCGRISCLEKAVEEQKHVIERVTKANVSMTTAETQTDFCPIPSTVPTYAEVTRSSSAHRSAPAPISAKPAKPHREENRPVRKNQSSKDCVVKSSNTGDEKTSSNVSVKKGNSRPIARSMKTWEENQDLPKVLIMQDSIMNGVHGPRLGRSYNFNATVIRSPTLSVTQKNLQEVTSEKPDAVVIHCGINDLKSKKAVEVSSSFVSMLKDTAKKNPSTKFVVSKTIPVKDQKMEVKRQLFNAVITSELYDTANISFVENDNLKSFHLRDNVHLTGRGSSVLAGNVGRHVRNLLWETPRKPARYSRSQLHQFYPNLPRHGWYNPYNIMRDWPVF